MAAVSVCTLKGALFVKVTSLCNVPLWAYRHCGSDADLFFYHDPYNITAVKKKKDPCIITLILVFVFFLFLKKVIQSMNNINT